MAWTIPTGHHDEPTRGIDIGNKGQITSSSTSFRRQGCVVSRRRSGARRLFRPSSSCDPGASGRADRAGKLPKKTSSTPPPAPPRQRQQFIHWSLCHEAPQKPTPRKTPHTHDANRWGELRRSSRSAVILIAGALIQSNFLAFNDLMHSSTARPSSQSCPSVRTSSSLAAGSTCRSAAMRAFVTGTISSRDGTPWCRWWQLVILSGGRCALVLGRLRPVQTGW